MTKSFISLTVFFFMLAPFSFADVYMKAKVMNGMGESETWTSGKKQRMVSRTALAQGLEGPPVKIIRADKGVEWEISNDLKAYQETPIPIPYEKEEPLTKEEKEAKKEWDKGIDDGLKASQEGACAEPKKHPEIRTIAGMKAEGYTPSCPNQQGPVSTLWMAVAGNAKADKIQKEMEAFEKAQLESRFSLYPPREREDVIKSMRLMALAMSQGLMGVPNTEKMPKRMPLAITNTAQAEDGSTVNSFLFEVLEIDMRNADPAMFEVPAGYQKVENLMELQSQRMMEKFSSGEVKMTDMIGNMEKMAQSMGMTVPKVDEAAEEAEAREAFNRMGQNSSQMIQQQMQMQGAWQAPRPAGPQEPTDAPTEAWQQGLYNQPRNPAPSSYTGAPNYPNAPPNYAQNMPPGYAQMPPPGYVQNPGSGQTMPPGYGYAPNDPQGYGQSPYGNQARQRRADPNAGTQQMLNTVQNIASQFGGMGGAVANLSNLANVQNDSPGYDDSSSESEYEDDYSEYGQE